MASDHRKAIAFANHNTQSQPVFCEIHPKQSRDCLGAHGGDRNRNCRQSGDFGALRGGVDRDEKGKNRDPEKGRS